MTDLKDVDGNKVDIGYFGHILFRYIIGCVVKDNKYYPIDMRTVGFEASDNKQTIDDQTYLKILEIYRNFLDETIKELKREYELD